jgi:hypothetical protein
MKKRGVVLSFLIITVGTSCTTLKLGIDLLLYDLNGSELINKEAQVRNRLETILFTPENYTMSGYTRQVFSPELKRTPMLYHSFYVITNKETSFFTLIFTGTKKRMRSTGAWAINTEFDMASYSSFVYGNNVWDVKEIPSSNGINIEMTIKRILYRIDNNTNYYYNDHRKDKNGMENCNTALQNTYVENN